MGSLRKPAGYRDFGTAGTVIESQVQEGVSVST